MPGACISTSHSSLLPTVAAVLTSEEATFSFQMLFKMSSQFIICKCELVKDRSSLQSIQLVILCRASTVKQHGYADVLHPFVQDLETLEQHGVYIEQLGNFVKGTLLFVSSDNLGQGCPTGRSRRQCW